MPNLPSGPKLQLKRSVAKGPVSIDDILDIPKLEFPEIEISEMDSIVACWKVGWRFALHFDFRGPKNDRLNPEDTQKLLGRFYFFLLFEKVYDSVSNTPHVEELIKDGWFPFVEILLSDYEQLSELYEHKFDFEELSQKWLMGFTRERIERMVGKWWNKKTFAEKRKILEAGINAFYGNSESGNIQCIKVLYSEIEGLLQTEFLPSVGKKLSFRELTRELRSKADSAAGFQGSVLFPGLFQYYLENSFFKNFDLKTGQLQISRHSAMHGVAKDEDYTRIRALQGLLLLDQIYFYL